MLSGKGLGATGAGGHKATGAGGAQSHGCRCVTWSRAWVGRLVVVRFVEWLEEWVSHSFGGQVGAWAVSWDDLD